MSEIPLYQIIVKICSAISNCYMKNTVRYAHTDEHGEANRRIFATFSYERAKKNIPVRIQGSEAEVSENVPVQKTRQLSYSLQLVIIFLDPRSVYFSSTIHHSAAYTFALQSSC